MLQLFLSEPTWSETGYEECIEQGKSLLDELQSVIWSLASSGGRSEFRLWLCKALAGIRSISSRHQQELLLSLLRSNSKKRHVAVQVLRLLFDKRPGRAGPVIAKRSHVLENFFKGNPRRILQWFSTVSGSGDLAQGKGLKALSQFAFVNRDICWEELEWRGKHGQSPAMVATKPHYFLDLDIQRTVENFLEYVPEFWSSNEFAESLKDGEILFIDSKYFINLFVDLMYKEDAKEVWEVLDEFLLDEPFSFWCHHLLIVLEEQELSTFLDLVRNFLDPSLERMDYSKQSNWLEIILSKCSGYSSIDQLLLLNALTSQARQLLHLVREEGGLEDKEKIKNIVFKICASSSNANTFLPIIKECFNRKTLESIKWLGLWSWALYYYLSEEYSTPKSWESLFLSNGIDFRKAVKYTLLHDESSEESEPEVEKSYRTKHKKNKRRRNKRKRTIDPDECYDGESIDFDMLRDGSDLQHKVGDWTLSTDGYSATWSTADLPEHVSKHCFFTWMKWVFVKNRIVA